jgi:hypothetical protein
MKSLSTRQYGTLQYIGSTGVSAEWIYHAHQGTVWSLAHRGYVVAKSGQLRLTTQGSIALAEYKEAKPSERLVPDDPSERVSRLLKLSRMRLSRENNEPEAA